MTRTPREQSAGMKLVANAWVARNGAWQVDLTGGLDMGPTMPRPAYQRRLARIPGVLELHERIAASRPVAYLSSVVQQYNEHYRNW
jgi:hypothetical protein